MAIAVMPYTADMCRGFVMARFASTGPSSVRPESAAMSRGCVPLKAAMRVSTGTCATKNHQATECVRARCARSKGVISAGRRR